MGLAPKTTSPSDATDSRQQLAAWLADDTRAKPVLLDVREPWELELCQLAGSQHIPMHLIPMRCEEIDAAAMLW
jgi:rhodanese-related sulfurtransferase